MRNILLLIMIASCINLFAQDDSIDLKFAPTLTEIGKPAGEKVSQKIDNNGGRIISSDGKIELVIPADAVPKKTDISIQPVTNTLSPGHASAYQLEPSGITFQKPLQIIFHYSQNESPGDLADLRGIAWQDDKGQWYALDSCFVDTITRTVTGNISHFSTWLFFDYFNLDPSQAKVKVGKQLNLVIVCTYPGRSGEFTQKTIPKINFSTYVNGVRGGNAVVGTVTPIRGNNYRNANYNAPGTVPDNNPVAVSVEASNITFNGRKYSKLKLVSNILVYDKAYKITVIGYNKQQVLTCVVRSIDSSS
ncbi:MAG: hypothetical protein ACHQF0_09015, partial [Chitinophagales bacterium]